MAALATSSSPVRLGLFLAAVEAALFAVNGALHAGWELGLGSVTFAQPLSPFAALAQGSVALALVVGLLLPGGPGVRAGRVMAAQVLAVIVIVVGQIALAFSDPLRTPSYTVSQLILFAMSVASMVLLGWGTAPRRSWRRPRAAQRS